MRYTYALHVCCAAKSSWAATADDHQTLAGPGARHIGSMAKLEMYSWRLSVCIRYSIQRCHGWQMAQRDERTHKTIAKDKDPKETIKLPIPIQKIITKIVHRRGVSVKDVWRRYSCEPRKRLLLSYITRIYFDVLRTCFARRTSDARQTGIKKPRY